MRVRQAVKLELAQRVGTLCKGLQLPGPFMSLCMSRNQFGKWEPKQSEKVKCVCTKGSLKIRDKVKSCLVLKSFLTVSESVFLLNSKKH